MVSPVLRWYDTTSTILIDLIGDYAGQELFLLEGDSLLYHCFEDKRLDFSHGLQLLHAVYMVEKFLENLIKRHCNFHIVFFEENANLCIPARIATANRSRYLLARSLIKRHLSSQTLNGYTPIKVLSFTDLNCTQFEEYLHKSPVYFVMIHDGSSPSNTAGENTSTADASQTIKYLLRAMIWTLNMRGLNVALINMIEFRDSKIFTMIVESIPIESKINITEYSDIRHDIQQAMRKLCLANLQVDDLLFSLDDLETSLDISPEICICEEYWITIYLVSKMLKNKKCSVLLASAYVLHVVLLKYLPLTRRSFPSISFNGPLENEINLFLSNSSNILQGVLNTSLWIKIMAQKHTRIGAVDLLDGRLFRAVLQAIDTHSFRNISSLIINGDWTMLKDIITKITGHKISYFAENKIISDSVVSFSRDRDCSHHKSKEFGLLPFSNKIFDKYFENIQINAENETPNHSGPQKIFRDSKPCHSFRRSIKSKPELSKNVSKWKNPTRLNQFYMREMTLYAASLTGSKGAVLRPETITVNPEKTKMSEKSGKINSSKKAPSNKGGGNKKEKILSKKDKLIASNKERIDDNLREKALTAWRRVLKSLTEISEHQDRYFKTVEFKNSLDSVKTTYLEWEANIYMLQTLIMWWAQFCEADQKNKGYYVVGLIWKTVRETCKLRSPAPREAEYNLVKVCSILQITNALIDFQPIATEKKLSFSFRIPKCSKSMDINMEQKEFQLIHCGPYMDRMLDAKPDDRVPNFVPDGWQREVLDQLDADNSVFVVAPTSAGKTFISFYAMEKVLRADNVGVIVYVAPTKALVNQIAAEIQGRFSKKYPTSGKSVWAIHTRDYRINKPKSCQIFVTVPHILQIMLLSPLNARSWAPRVRRIIFDEIHSIGHAEDGVIWEQLLLLAPCPIIALSATVGNPTQFNDWLTQVQKQNGTNMEMIQHKTRYSDLRKFLYDPPTNFQFSGLEDTDNINLGLDGLEGFKSMHPATSLIDKSRGIPDDLALEPKDCLNLWKALCMAQNESYRVPSSLDPKEALPAFIQKKHIFLWEAKIKELLTKWMEDDNSPFNKTIEILSELDLQRGEESPESSTSPKIEVEKIKHQDLNFTTLPLLCQLHKRKALPAILFNYNRTNCENIASAILKQLTEAEIKWKEGPSWKKTIDGYEKWKSAKLSNKSNIKPNKKSKASDREDVSKLDRLRDEHEVESSIYDSFDPNDPLKDFTFANFKHLSKSELDEIIYGMRFRNINESLINLLMRGVGVHHSGLNRKYRQCVEILFRKGFLGVVIATGTLSL